MWTEDTKRVMWSLLSGSVGHIIASYEMPLIARLTSTKDRYRLLDVLHQCALGSNIVSDRGEQYESAEPRRIPEHATR